MKDFFISYTSADENWATWIAWQLEEVGYSVIIQAWDFRPGSNFILEMDTASKAAERTLAVLSRRYLEAVFPDPEWAAALAQDPKGLARKLVPIRIDECEPEGLLRGIVYINLVGKSEEAARLALLEGLRSERAKPEKPPQFPGEEPIDRVVPKKPSFPLGPEEFPVDAPKVSETSGGYMPKIRREITDLDKRRFVKETFQTVRQKFETSLERLKHENDHVEYEFTLVDQGKFTCEIFVDGQTRARCKIWLDSGHSSGHDIKYAEGHLDISQDSSYNDALSVDYGSDVLALSALGGIFYGVREGIDPNHLSAPDAAEYLWHKFASPLER